MTRLTSKENFCEIADCPDFPCLREGGCLAKQAWEQLKEYEDTGLTPEGVRTYLFDERCTKVILGVKLSERISAQRLTEIIEAEMDGRLVVLPCKDGFKGMAEQQELLREWEKNCDGWRDLFFECRDHPWRNLWVSILKKAGFLNSNDLEGADE